MAMTTTQVQAILDKQTAGNGDNGDLPTSGGGGGGYDPSLPPTSPANAKWLREHGFDPNTFGKNPTSTALPPGWIINSRTGGLIRPSNDPTSSTEIGIGNLFDEGGTVYRWNGHTITKASVADTRSYWATNPNGTPSGDQTGGGSSGGSSGGSAPNKQAVKVGNDYYTFDPATGQYELAIQGQQDPQQQFDNAMSTRNANFADRGQDASILSNRANTGLSLGDLVRNLANDSYSRAADPGNFPAYLASIAGLPQGSGSPVAALLGKGVQIQSPEGSNPLADPRFQKLLDSEYTYGTVPDPAGVNTVRDIANQNGGTLPQAFYDWTHTQNPNPPKYAHGGMQMLNEPVIGIGLQSGQQKFLAGEAGKEKITFQPVHSHTSQGVSVPHQHSMGDVMHEHAYPGAQASFKHYAEGGTAVTPAQGTDMALGKALPNDGYGEQGLQDQLNSGNGPTPGSVDEATWANMSPSLRLLLQSGIKAQLGRSGLMDWLDELDKYQLPVVGNGGYSTVMNQ